MDKETRLRSLSSEFIDSQAQAIVDTLDVVPQLILCGPPGTGKTTMAHAAAARIFGIKPTSQIFVKGSKQEKAFNNYRLPATGHVKTNGCWDMIQMHPAFTYEDMIGCIRPDLRSPQFNYTLIPGKFKKFCDYATEYRTEDANASAAFVFIIDEINQVNLAEVLGEMSYLLEYRGNSINTPYFKRFSIPKNVYVIGTMNDADKNLHSIDMTTKRRFAFKHMAADMEIVRAVLYATFGLTNAERIDKYVAACKEINAKLEDTLNLGPRQIIGHAYFIRIKEYLGKYCKREPFADSTELEQCKQLLWQQHILPLLESYLEDDDSKTQNLYDIELDFCAS